MGDLFHACLYFKKDILKQNHSRGRKIDFLSFVFFSVRSNRYSFIN